MYNVEIDACEICGGPHATLCVLLLCLVKLPPFKSIHRNLGIGERTSLLRGTTKSESSASGQVM